MLRELLSYIRMRLALRSVSTIPGPPAHSIFSGKPNAPFACSAVAVLIGLHIGNLTQLIARDAEDFQRHVATDYGSVTKLNGFFGVGSIYFWPITTRI